MHAESSGQNFVILPVLEIVDIITFFLNEESRKIDYVAIELLYRDRKISFYNINFIMIKLANY